MQYRPTDFLNRHRHILSGPSNVQKAAADGMKQTFRSNSVSPYRCQYCARDAFNDFIFAVIAVILNTAARHQDRGWECMGTQLGSQVIHVIERSQTDDAFISTIATGLEITMENTVVYGRDIWLYN